MLFLMWESVSGVLMNHPYLISGISVPGWLVPEQYHIENWNRSALTKVLYSSKEKNRLFGCGKLGIWESRDGGINFHSYMSGYPGSAYYRKTNDIYLLKNDSIQYLFAAADGGFYYNNTENDKWNKIELGENTEKVKRILYVKGRIIVFTESNVYRSDSSYLNFQKVDLQKADAHRQVSLIDLFFHLHDGEIWGLPGKLLFDLVGVVIFFLSLSAFYVWYFPKIIRRKRRKKIPFSRKEKKFYRIFFKYHLKLGIWAAAITIIIAVTGLFMRPPMLVLLLNGSIDAEYYPGFLPDNIWEEQIQNALYDPVEDRILIAAKDGIYSGKADFSEPFTKYRINVPVFVMGATVFDNYGEHGYMIGSFSGLFYQDKYHINSVDLITGIEVNSLSNVRPSPVMVTGYFQTPSGEEFISAYNQGLMHADNVHLNGRFNMPIELKENFRMSLWNYLFEIHNGRFFSGILGQFYILIVPLGALLFLIIILSGIIDWIFMKSLKKKKTIKINTITGDKNNAEL